MLSVVCNLLEDMDTISTVTVMRIWRYSRALNIIELWLQIISTGIKVMSAALSAAVVMLLLLQNPLDEKHLSVQKYRWIQSILENNANPPVIVASVAEASH